jgi:hypothetical protein
MIYIVMKKKDKNEFQKVSPDQVTRVTQEGSSVIVTSRNEKFISPMDKDSTMTWWYRGAPEVFEPAA